MSKPTLKARSDNGMIYVHWRDQAGKLQRKSTDTKDLKVARQRMASIVSGQWAAPTMGEKAAQAKSRNRVLTAENVTMAHLIDRCRTTIWAPTRVRSQSTIASQCRILNRLIGGELVASMTYRRLEDLAQELRAKGYAEATVDRKLSAVGAALTQATKETDDQGRPWLTGKPAMPQFAADNFCERTLSWREEEIVFAIIAERAKLEPQRDWLRFGHLVRFLLDTAARKGEALQVRNDPTHIFSRVRESDGIEYTYVTFHQTKNGKKRTLPLSPAVVESLSYLRAAATNGRLFPFKAGGVNYMWTNVRADAKADHDIDLSDVKIHTLRHTCITRKAVKSGTKGDIHKISQFAGHSGIAITAKRYAHLMPEDLIDML